MSVLLVLLFLFVDAHAFTFPAKKDGNKVNFLVFINPKYLNANKLIEVRPVQTTEITPVVNNFLYQVTYYNNANFTQKQISLSYLLGSKQITQRSSSLADNKDMPAEDVNYPGYHLFPYYNLNTKVFAEYTNPKEITIFVPNKFSNDQARLIVENDLNLQNYSLIQAELNGVIIVYRPVSEITAEDNIIGTGN